MSFAFMIDQIFNDPVVSKAAHYKPKDTTVAFPVRVTLDRPDEVASFGDAQLHGASTIIGVRISEVEEPKAGDLVTVEARDYQVMGEPRADRERLVWRLAAYET